MLSSRGHIKRSVASATAVSTAKRVIAGPPVPLPQVLFWTLISMAGYLSFLLLPGKVLLPFSSSSSAAQLGQQRGRGLYDMAVVISHLHLSVWMWPLVDFIYRFWMILCAAPAHAIGFYPAFFFDSAACADLIASPSFQLPSSTTVGTSAERAQHTLRVHRFLCGDTGSNTRFSDARIVAEARTTSSFSIENFLVLFLRSLRCMCVGEQCDSRRRLISVKEDSSELNVFTELSKEDKENISLPTNISILSAHDRWADPSVLFQIMEHQLGPGHQLPPRDLQPPLYIKGYYSHREVCGLTVMTFLLLWVSCWAICSRNQRQQRLATNSPNTRKQSHEVLSGCSPSLLAWMCLLSSSYAFVWLLVKAMPILIGSVYPVGVCILVVLSLAVPST